MTFLSEKWLLIALLIILAAVSCSKFTKPLISENWLEIQLFDWKGYYGYEMSLYKIDTLSHGNYFLKEIDSKNKRDRQKISNTQLDLLQRDILNLKSFNSEFKINRIYHFLKFDSIAILDFIDNVENKYHVYSPDQIEHTLSMLSDSMILSKEILDNFPQINKLENPTIRLKFRYNGNLVEIALWKELGYFSPILIDKNYYYSLDFLKNLYKLIPLKKHERSRLQEDKIRNNIYSSIVSKGYRKLQKVGAQDFEAEINDALSDYNVINRRLINGVLSTNWNGSRRLAFKVLNQKDDKQISMMYSSTVLDMTLKSELDVIPELMDLYKNIVNSIPLFTRFLAANSNHHISIIIDDNRISDKVIERSSNCLTDKKNRPIIYLALFDANGGHSNWIVCDDHSILYWLDFGFDKSFDSKLESGYVVNTGKLFEVCDFYPW